MRLNLILLFLTVCTLFAQGQQSTIMIQNGHTNLIYDIAISPDDQLLATGGIDQVIHIWNLHTGKLLKQYTNKDAIYCLDFDRDNSLLSGGYGIDTEAFKYWDIESGNYAPMQVYGGTQSIEFSSGQKYMAVGNSKGSIALYQFEDEYEGLWYYITGKDNSMSAVAFSPDESLIAGGYSDIDTSFSIYLWSTESDTLLEQFEFEGGIETIHFLNNNQLLVEEQSWGLLNKVYLLDLETGEKEFVTSMSSLIVLQDNRRVIGMSKDYTLTIFDIIDREPIKDLAITQRFATNIALNHDESLIILANRDIEAVNMLNGKQAYFIEGAEWIEAMSFASEGNRLAFTGNEGRIINWDMETGEVDVWKSHHSKVLDLVFDPKGNYLASASMDSTVIIWNQNRTIKHWWIFPDNEFNTLSINPAGDMLAISMGDTIYSVGIQEGYLSEKFSLGEDKEAEKVIYSPNGRDVAYLVYNYLLVYDMEAGYLRLQKSIGDGGTEDLAFSGDGKFIAASGYCDSLFIYNLESDSLEYKISNDGGYVISLAFDPNSLLLAAGYDDGRIKLFDIADGREVAVFEAHKNLVNKLSFRRDGEVLASNSWDGKLALWDMKELTKLAELYAFPDETWAVIDATGRYDASNGGSIDHLHFAVGMEAISLDQLKERYYEPGLLQKLLGYNAEPLRDVNKLGAIGLFPASVLKIDRDILEVQLTERGGGIGRIQLLVNDKEVEYDLSSHIKSGKHDNAFSLSVKLQQYNTHYKLNERNTISIMVYNRDNYLASSKQSINYAPTTKRGGNAFTNLAVPVFYSINIGTADYRGKKLDLSFADKDARQFSSAVQQMAASFFGKDHVEVITLETGNKDALPTKTNIIQAFTDVAKKARPFDVLMVYMSGHGVNYSSADGQEFHYLTMDVESGNIDDAAIRRAYSISTAELTEWIKAIPVEKQVLILDACASGQAIDDLMVSRKSVSSDQVRALERLKDRTGMFILTGSASDKVSFEANRFGQSLLTYSLLAGMKGQALRDEKFVDVLRLFEYAVETVPQLAAQIGGVQKPILAIPYGGSSFDIGQMDENVLIELPSVKPIFIRSVFQDENMFDDVLSISEKIDSEFRNLAARAKNAELIFVDVSNYTDAYSIRGRYNKVGDEILVRGKVFFDRELIGDFELIGPIDDIDSLAREIIMKAHEVIE